MKAVILVNFHYKSYSVEDEKSIKIQYYTNYYSC